VGVAFGWGVLAASSLVLGAVLNRRHYVNNFVGMTEEKIAATEDLPTGEDLILSASFDKSGEDPSRPDCSHSGTATRRSARGRSRHNPEKITIGGERLCIGRVGAAGVTTDYSGKRPWPFTGRTIRRVAIDVSGGAYIDLEREAAATLMLE